MKIQRMLALLLVGGSLMFLSACNTVGTRFTPPDLDKLEFGKMQPADAVALFGKPASTWINTDADGNFVVYKYSYGAAGFSTFQWRVLLLEFKNGKLNAYYWWSSFIQDKTKFDPSVEDKLRAGTGKLTKDDVVDMVGKPNAKGFCPSMIEEFKGRCAKNTEVWGWIMPGDINLWIQKDIKASRLFVTFDASGKVSDVDTEESTTPNR